MRSISFAYCFLGFGFLSAAQSELHRLAPLPIEAVLDTRAFAQLASLQFSPDGKWLLSAIQTNRNLTTAPPKESGQCRTIDQLPSRMWCASPLLGTRKRWSKTTAPRARPAFSRLTRNVPLSSCVAAILRREPMTAACWYTKHQGCSTTRARRLSLSSAVRQITNLLPLSAG